MSEELKAAKRLAMFCDGLMPAERQDCYRTSGSEFADTCAVVKAYLAEHAKLLAVRDYQTRLETMAAACLIHRYPSDADLICASAYNEAARELLKLLSDEEPGT